MEMLLHDTADRSSESIQVYPVENFSEAKKELENAILEFDKVLRLNFSGSYNIEINSYGLTSDEVSYEFANSGQNSTNAYSPNLPTLIVKDSIKRPLLEYAESV